MNIDINRSMDSSVENDQNGKRDKETEKPRVLSADAAAQRERRAFAADFRAKGLM
jgi:hypothetical protein